MKEVSAFKLFLIFSKMGAFTIGGGYAMIPLIEKELVSRGWIGNDEIREIIVLAQSAPGILAVNMAIYTGHRLCGIKGSILAAIGAVLPSFIIILLIAMFFTNFQQNALVQSIFRAVRPVAVALILAPAVRMARKSCLNWWTALIALGTIIAVVFLKVSPIWIILVTIVLAAGISALREKR